MAANMAFGMYPMGLAHLAVCPLFAKFRIGVKRSAMTKSKVIVRVASLRKLHKLKV
jgi:hypothetical protein